MRTTEDHYQSMSLEISQRADVIFSKLLLFQWALSIFIALFVSPFTWNGVERSLHPHVYLALIMGGILALGPIASFRLLPNHPRNRDLVAFAQMMFSTLLIHVTGGRIETHFHIFGSIAFLSYYRSKSPIWIAAIVTFADHLIRGYFWPESVYGVAYASPLRAFEHGAWVLFEVGVILEIIRNGQEQMRSIAKTYNQLDTSLEATAKMSSLGEFMSGIAHEINNPLTIIKSCLELCEMREKKSSLSQEEIKKHMEMIKKNTTRITKIIQALKNFSRFSQNDPMEIIPVQKLLGETLEICQDSLKTVGIELKISFENDSMIECHPSEIQQILINLVGNAKDAIINDETKWIHVDAKQNGDFLEISVTDSGRGIPPETLKNLMTPFFTTKPPGTGTGLGLNISRKLAEGHQGSLEYRPESPHTCFVLKLPLKRRS